MSCCGLMVILIQISVLAIEAYVCSFVYVVTFTVDDVRFRNMLKVGHILCRVNRSTRDTPLPRVSLIGIVPGAHGGSLLYASDKSVR